MLFGIGQLFGVAGFQSSQATAVYDKLKLDLQPVPSSSWLFAGALALLAILGRRWPVFRRRPIC